MGTAAQSEESTTGLRVDIGSLTGLDWLGIALASITGLVHLYLYWIAGFVPFLLAGLGFFGAVGLLLTTFPSWVLYLVGIPYTGIQIVLWVVLGTQSFTIGVIDKTVQVLLIGLLIALLTIETEIGFLEWFGSLFDDDRQ